MGNESYTYNPANLGENGRDMMRFELGDTMVESGKMTAYLSDEEIDAMLARYKSWDMAKFKLVESVLRRFSYEVDTKTGPMELSLDQRYKKWKDLYDELKRVAECANSAPAISVSMIGRKPRPPYFYEGLHDNHACIGRRGEHDVFKSR